MTVNDVAESSIWLHILKDYLRVVIAKQQESQG